MLSESQRRVLEVLIRGGGAPVPRVTLRAVAFGAEQEEPHGPVSARALDMLISRIRKKIAAITPAGTEVPRIVARRGDGYSIDAG